MSAYYYNQAHQPQVNAHPTQHHHGRSRRNPRMAAQKQQFRPARSTKDIVEAAAMNAFRRDFEAAKSFDLEDDELFCPFHLLTQDDVRLDSLHSSVTPGRTPLLTPSPQLSYIHTSGSDRSSLSSGSPESSPLQHQLQPTPSFVLSSSSSYGQTGYQNSNMKIHQPLAQRTRNAIPIVDPTTRAVASPPPSVSPGRQMQQQYMNRRW